MSIAKPGEHCRDAVELIFAFVNSVQFFIEEEIIERTFDDGLFPVGAKEIQRFFCPIELYAYKHEPGKEVARLCEVGLHHDHRDDLLLKRSK